MLLNDVQKRLTNNMPAGRPRTVVPEKEELIKLGEDLLNWAKNPDPENPHFFWSEWYTSKGFVRNQWKKMVDKEEFRSYYEQAQPFLARPYINGTINASIAHRFLRHYCPDVKEEENEEMELKEKIKAEMMKNVIPPNDSKIDQENQDMQEKHQLRMKIKELEENIDNLLKTRSELHRS